MAVGDLADVMQRITVLLPPWFGNGETPDVDGIIAAFAKAGNIIYTQYAYTALQTRIKTATDTNLDLIAVDFFGPTGLLRRTNESDAQYRNRILINLIRIRGTRPAIVNVLQDLTGRTPFIFEPSRPGDTGGYSVGGVGYGAGGGWGSLEQEYQAFCIAYRPIASGVPYVGGYCSSVGAYSTPSRLQWANISLLESAVPDEMIYSAIDNVKSAGTVIWTQIQS
jgi:hypothetical protein